MRFCRRTESGTGKELLVVLLVLVLVGLLLLKLK